jgi:16S rRNA (cytosine1402-N4)-methyltransferase
MSHIPVLQKETLEYLDPKKNENFVDCTADGGGHATAIIEKIGPNGKLLAIDLDEEMILNLKKKSQSGIYKNRLIVARGNFADLKNIIEENKFKKVSGILLDLGFSSYHVDESGRGFSFLKNEPLDMRYDQKAQLTAEKIINYWSEADIEKILREYGEERFSGQIAEEIIEARKITEIKSTFQLLGVIRKSVSGGGQSGKIHFATKTFQALRIAVNGELDNLGKVLPQAIDVLEKGGRLAVISFHSLEDRIVKNFLKMKAKDGSLHLLAKKPVQASREEVNFNPRSRSAKLRAAEKQ